MPDELRDRMEEIVVAYRAIRAKESHIGKRLEARIAPYRIAMGELIDHYNERLARLGEKKRALSGEFLALWSEHLPGLRTVRLPSATVRRRKDIKVAVRDKREVIDALDRLDRLDLVDEVVDEKGLRTLAREGKLDGLPEGAVEVQESMGIVVYPRKDG
jgi:hypothetical protein